MRLPDVNVLVNAFRSDAPEHARYRAWLLALIAGPAPFAVSDLVLSGFLRVVTNPAVARLAMDPAAARAFVEAIRSRPNCVVLASSEGHWRRFMSLIEQLDIRGPRIADAYHAALAIEHGCEWVSDDSDFARFPGLRWSRPLDQD